MFRFHYCLHYVSVLLFGCLLICIVLPGITVSAASVATANQVKVNIDGYTFYDGSSSTKRSVYVPNVTITRGETYNYVSGYVDVPVQLVLRPGNDSGSQFRGSYTAPFKVSLNYFNAIAETSFSWSVQWGLPYAIDSPDGIDFQGKLYSGSTSSSAYQDDIAGSIQLSTSEIYSFIFHFRDLVISNSTGIYNHTYPFVIRIPFTIACTARDYATANNLIDWKVENYGSPSNSLYVENDPSYWSIGQDGYTTQVIRDKIQQGQEQAHADALAAQEQAHADAVNAQQQASEAEEKASQERKNIFDKISDFFGSFFSNLLEGVKSLFIPSSEDLQSFLDEMKQFLDDHLGFLYLPVDLTLRFIDLIYNDDSNNTVITLPGFSISGFTVWEPIQFDILNDFVFSDYRIRDLFTKIQFVSNVVLIGLFVNLCNKKLHSVMGGGDSS